MVLVSKGKKATKKAQINVAISELSTHIEISGAIAIIGETCKTTVIGIIVLSTILEK